MQNPHFPGRKAAFILTALLCLFLTGFSTARAEGYQLSQNLQPNQTLASYRVSADGKYAVYQIDSFDENFNQSSQLFSVDVATKARKVLTPVLNNGDGKFLGSYKITPDSRFVVYIASLENDAFFRSELYSIPIAAGSQSQRRNIGNIPSASSADVREFSISPNSQHVVYQTNEENSAGDDFDILFRVAPTGGSPTQLTPRVAEGSAENAIFTPDSSRIVYQYRTPSGDSLYQSVSITGTGRKTLTDQVSGGSEPSITPDSERFVFTADPSSGSGELRLFSITLSGNETLKQLSRNGEEVFNFKFANGFPVVVYAFKLTSNTDVFSPTSFGFVAADKSFQSVAYDTGKQINSFNFAVTPDNRAVIYLAAGESFGPEQLYSLTFQNNAAVDQKISNAPADQMTFDGVSDFKIAPNSQRAVFRATQGGAFTPDLFSVAIANNPVAVKLNDLPGESGASAADFGVNSYFITPNSQRVVFTYPPSDGSCCGRDFYANAIAGGTPTGPFATGANDDPFSGGGAPVLTADGRRVIYSKTVFDENFNQATTLWAANVPQ